jgi:hypothetical protein
MEVVVMRESKKKEVKQKSTSKKHERSAFSPAIMKIAEDNLKKLAAQSDEGFLVRAEMDRKLSSL